jgi:hypothetical protein
MMKSKATKRVPKWEAVWYARSTTPRSDGTLHPAGAKERKRLERLYGVDAMRAAAKRFPADTPIDT